MSHRTVLVIAHSNERSSDYRQQLQQDSRFNYRILLEQGHTPILPLFQSQSIDGILLDLRSSQSESIQFLHQLKTQIGDRCPPIVVIDAGDTAIAIQAFKNGAADYLVRDQTTPEDLRFAMRSAIENAELRRELQRSQQQFQTSVENMLDCFGIFSAMRDESGQIVDFRIDYLNGAACENNQMPKEAQVGRGLCEILPAHRESGLFDEYCRLVETGEPLIKDSIIYEDCYGGQRLVRAFDIRATKLNDGFVASWRDITARKQMELELTTITDIHHQKQTEIALQQNQERLELAMRAAKMGSWDLDIQTGQVNWSTNLEHLFGMAPGSFDGQYETVRTMIHPDDLPRVEQAIHRAVHEREEYNIEFRFIKPDGTVRWALSLGRVFYDALGNPVAMTGVDMDISERKRIEQDLRAGEERFRHLADNTPMMIWVRDTQGNCTYLNQRWYDFTGQTEATGLGLGWLAAVHPDDRESSRMTFFKAVERREAFRMEYRLRCQTGEYRWMLSAGSPWIEPDGEFRGHIGSVVDIHDRKQAELALQETHIQLEAALKAGAIYTWRWNITEDVFTFDRNFSHLFGVDPEQAAIGLPLSVLLNRIHPDDRPRITAAVEHAIATGENYTAEYRVINADGEERVVIARGRVEYDANGNAIAFPGAITDITERIQDEEAMRLSEERYRTLFESMNDGFCVVEMLFDEHNTPIDYRFLEINPVFEQQTGLKQAEGKTARQLIPDLEPHWFEIYGNVALTGESVRFENGSDAMNRWFDVSAFRIGRPENRKVAILFKDISDRKQTEAALQKNESRLRLALESAELGTWDFNPITGVLKWDDQCKAMFGLPPEAEITYDTFLAGLHPEDRDRTDQVVQRTFNPESGGEYDIEFRTVGIEDGIERWVAAKGKAFFNSRGEAVRFIGTVLNITEKKQAEAEREQLLQREQAARAEAERANRIKDEFLAVLSHELRSPLNPILGWTKLLQTRQFDQAQTAQALDVIERNAKLQTQLIDDLLDLAKILRGKLSLNVSSVNLSFVVEAAIDTMRTAAITKSITLHSVLPNVGQVYGDAARLQQIVWNLLSNAIKFTPKGGRVEIGLERIEHQAHITVRDTGKGINPDFLPRLFESFQQEDASITRKYGGLGLGLAIVRQLVEAHGGTITADSPGEGLGATFTVRLPLLNAEPEIQQRDELPQQELDLTGIRALVVDDDPDARELLSILLTGYGAEVMVVTSASEVLANMASFRPDVLVSDIGMPNVDGYTLIRQIRALAPEQGGQTPAIALTAYAREDDHERAISSGFQRHVTKPLDLEQLIQAIMAVIQ